MSMRSCRLVQGVGVSHTQDPRGESKVWVGRKTALSPPPGSESGRKAGAGEKRFLGQTSVAHPSVWPGRS